MCKYHRSIDDLIETQGLFISSLLYPQTKHATSDRLASLSSASKKELFLKSLSSVEDFAKTYEEHFTASLNLIVIIDKWANILDAHSLSDVIASIIKYIASRTLSVRQCLMDSIPEIADYHAVLIASAKAISPPALFRLTTKIVLTLMDNPNKPAQLSVLVYLCAISGINFPPKSRHLVSFLYRIWPQLKSLIMAHLLPYSIDVVLLLIHNWTLDRRLRSIILSDRQYIFQPFLKCMSDNIFLSHSQTFALSHLSDILFCLKSEVASDLPSIISAVISVAQDCIVPMDLGSCLKCLIPAVRYLDSDIVTCYRAILPTIFILMRSPGSTTETQYVMSLAGMVLAEILKAPHADFSAFSSYVKDVYDIATQHHVPLVIASEILSLISYRYNLARFYKPVGELSHFIGTALPVIVLALQRVKAGKQPVDEMAVSIFPLLSSLLDAVFDVSYIPAIFDPLGFELCRIVALRGLQAGTFVDKSCVAILALYSMYSRSHQRGSDRTRRMETLISSFKKGEIMTDELFKELKSFLWSCGRKQAPRHVESLRHV
ncbi:hypothetical protein CVT26_001265 [Gymnopilus dilepis]|uniref:Uncharacterized protein n=1 Tax=Gymnopilus dilepis TaxID=231916 RepID=A0A409WEH8_9AGAR|nr:hypothetical protein CVT26_001265 [Gymnopilus dilepis]